MEPPTYANVTSTSGNGTDESGPAELPALLNLVPRPGEVGFQSGYLGYTNSTLRGILQVKFTDGHGANSYRASVDRVEVELVGVEQINDSPDGIGVESRKKDSNVVELVRDLRVLWQRDDVTGRSDASKPSTSGPPGNIDFSLDLTDDLPHCCHIGSGSIKYTLTARLHGRSVVKLTTPIHITRTSAPPRSQSVSAASSSASISRIADTQACEIYTSQHPTEASIFFPHGTSAFTRSESIELRVRIPPPDRSLVEEKGLKLRSVSAELVRVISIREPDLSEEKDIAPLLDTPALSTSISRSGKSAAFSPLRSVFLNIWLQPVSAEICECISQSTIYQETQFFVKVVLAVAGKQGDREDIVICNRPVIIIPDYPPAALHQHMNSEARGQSLVANARYTSQATNKTKTGELNGALLEAFLQETEYDGYEQLSADMGSDNAPPSINADVPPPSIGADHSPGVLSTEGCTESSEPAPESTANDDAPPYSTTMSGSVTRAAENAVDTRTSASPAVPVHHDHHGEGPVPPPPPYEGGRHAALVEQGLDEQDDQTLNAMRQSMQELLSE